MDTPSPFSFLLLLLLSLLAAAEAAGRLPPFGPGPEIGGWETIKNVSAPHIVNVGEYAVTEHNWQSKQDLHFVRVLSGKQQVVAGMNYALVIQAYKGDPIRVPPRGYEAVVYEREWDKYRNLISFEPLP